MESVRLFEWDNVPLLPWTVKVNWPVEAFGPTPNKTETLCTVVTENDEVGLDV